MRTLSMSVGLRIAVILHLLPYILVPMVAAVLLGLARREAAGRGAAWSSSTFTRIGFYGVVLSLIAIATYVLSSLPHPTVYGPLSLFVLSAYLYIGNMPCKV